MSGFVPNWRAGAEGMLDFPGINGGYYQELILSAEFLNSIRSHGKG